MDEPSIERLVRIFMKMKAAHQKLEAEATEIEEQMKQVKLGIKDLMQASGLLSSKTTYGTVTLTQKRRYYTDDWDSFKQFMKERDALDLLEKRIAQKNMSQYLEENPNDIPPGLNSVSEFDVSVRKPAAA